MSVKKWEYALICDEQIAALGGAQKVLDKYGAQGWELVAVTEYCVESAGTLYVRFYFKREAK